MTTMAEKMRERASSVMGRRELLWTKTVQEDSKAILHGREKKVIRTLVKVGLGNVNLFLSFCNMTSILIIRLCGL
jgi:hypothetical protein